MISKLYHVSTTLEANMNKANGPAAKLAAVKKALQAFNRTG